MIPCLSKILCFHVVSTTVLWDLGLPIISYVCYIFSQILSTRSFLSAYKYVPVSSFSCLLMYQCLHAQLPKDGTRQITQKHFAERWDLLRVAILALVDPSSQILDLPVFIVSLLPFWHAFELLLLNEHTLFMSLDWRSRRQGCVCVCLCVCVCVCECGS